MAYLRTARSGALAMLLAVFLSITPEAQAATTNTTTIDFSTVSIGNFDQSYFLADDGIYFTEGSFVGFFQGDNALAGPIAANVTGGFTRLSAQVALGFQGTATYTLTAYKHGRKIASTTLAVTDDQGGPTTSGYFSIGLVTRKADSFSLSNDGIEFGVSSITISR